MIVTDYVCGSCAAAGISDLGSHKDAFDAICDLFKKTLGEGTGGGRYAAAGQKQFSTMNSHYIFIAGPEAKPREAGRSHHSKEWVKYGTEFAQYLLDHKLGIVSTAGQILNTKYHPTTTCQVWVFQPNQKACERWWSKASVQLITINKAKALARAAQIKEITDYVKDHPEAKQFPRVNHYGYSPAKNVSAGNATGQVLTITRVTPSYAYYHGMEQDPGICLYLNTRTNEPTPQDLVVGTYLITHATYDYWTLVQVPEGFIAPVKLPTFTFEEPEVECHIEVPVVQHTVKRRRWKMVPKAGGIKVREYFWEERPAGLPQAYSINPNEALLEVPPNEQVKGVA